MSEWHPISTAPRDGTCVLLLARVEKVCAIGRWDADGDSWCDALGRYPGDSDYDADTLALRATGVWISCGGWFQPNEVSHWMPLPVPPDERASR